MSRYRIAQVRFSPNGRQYSVNCRLNATAGDKVLVRMDGQSTPLQVAEVVSLGYGSNSCRNSIVCKEAVAEEYGDGPAGIDDEVKLHRFLKLLGWRSYFAREKRDGGLLTTPSFDWPIVYERDRESTLSTLGSIHRLLGPAETLHLGREGVGFMYWDEHRSIEVEDGHLVFNEGLHPLRFEGPNPLVQAAEWAEGDLAPDVDPPADTSLRQIRDAISPDGGPAYLSDGEWL